MNNISMRTATAVINVDQDAVVIGNLISEAKASIVTSVVHAIEAGKRLVDKKDQLPHGKWLIWLGENAETLGFSSDSTARRLMTLAKRALTHDLDEQAALTLSRQLWGNATEDSQLIQQSLSNEHYTPPQYIDAARRVMGGIDLDPATCLPANETVKAANIFTSADDGLKQPWHGRIWLNPPYGRLVGDFIAKLMAEFAAGNAKDAVVLVNAHCTDTSWFQALWNAELCFTDHRINFYGDDARSGSTHGSVFAYFGPSTELFVSEFKVFGPIVRRISDDYPEPRSV